MAETFTSAVISDLHPFFCNWHNEEMTESPISAVISNLRYKGEKYLQIRGLACLQIFFVWTRIKCLYRFKINRKLFIFKSEKRERFWNISSFAWFKNFKKIRWMNLHTTINIKTNIYAYIRLKRLDIRT